METHQKAGLLADSGSNRWLYIILAVFAIVIIGLSIWLISTKSDLRLLQDEKESQRIMLQHEVDSLIAVHNKTKEAYGALADSLVAKDSIIQANAKEIKVLLDTQWEYYKIKRKLEQLQSISQNYVRQMDSLYTVNRELEEENERIREEAASERKRAQQWIKTADALSEQVEQAAIFKTYNVEVTGIRQRGRGETETDRVQRIERIKICFTLAENKIIQAGNKNIYIRIAAPDSRILVKSRDDSYSFIFKGERLQYSIMEVVDYQNADQEICVYWDKRDTQDLSPGLYYVDIYEGDHQIGEANLLLR
ncbi:MAG: hypothetical protein WCR58_06455 [Bacteroidales bacterium]|jgi:hypothetical protein|nr:hypothetical protein [Bacteroidales bacterium]MCK9448664.1 hypothetical protein [Bacteroidales bacterium]MDD3702201.1 hypothetical protein [Bacteroidales bacterium]MDY0368925.1 hypothetical protein [Bacteroidales bacterium]